MKNLQGLDGAKAVYLGANEISALDLDRRQQAVVTVHSRLAHQHLQNLKPSFTRDLSAKFAKSISHTPNAAKRLEAYNSLLSNVLAVASKVMLADLFATSLKSHGLVAHTASVMAGKPVVDPAGGLINTEAMHFGIKDGISFVNNVRELLNQIFVDNEGNPNHLSAAAINRFMKQIEQAMQKNVSHGVNSALLLTASNAERLVERVNDFIIQSNLAASKDLMNTMELNNTPKPGV